MTPKSLLRHKLCISEAEDFLEGSSFHRVLWDDAQKGNSDTQLVADDKIRRVVMCSGKVYFDLWKNAMRAGSRISICCAWNSSIRSRPWPF
jgi:2-oxoglutarate dehydrogenase E1 component